MSEMIPQTKMQWIGFFVWLILTMVVEYWLGKTQKTRAGSTLELVLLTSIAAYLFLITKLRRSDSNGS